MSVDLVTCEELLTTGESARELEKSADSVRRYEEEGLLPAAFKTRSGLRLFRVSDVERLKQRFAAREAHRAKLMETAPAEEAHAVA